MNNKYYELYWWRLFVYFKVSCDHLILYYVPTSLQSYFNFNMSTWQGIPIPIICVLAWFPGLPIILRWNQDRHAQSYFPPLYRFLPCFYIFCVDLITHAVILFVRCKRLIVYPLKFAMILYSLFMITTISQK